MLRDPRRYPYQFPWEKPRLAWPGGARVAFWVVPNIEFYELMPPAGAALSARPAPDISAYGLRDYGNRVGIRRVFDALDCHGVTATACLNAAMCEHYPEIVEGCVARSWDFIAHGVYNNRVIYGMDEDEVAAVLGDSVGTISRFTGKAVKGWLAPAVSSTETFLDLLPGAGLTYTIDVVPDDQPIPITVRSGRLISVPYSAEINDIRVIGMRAHSADEWAAMAKAAFDRLYEEGRNGGKVFCLPLHPYLIGQSHRIAALEEVLAHVTRRADVWTTTGSAIADHYLATCGAVSAPGAGPIP